MPPNVNIDTCVQLGFKPTTTGRQHVRFFPRIEDEGDGGDRSGNCVAGTVVDGDVVNLNPVEFDFYLLS